MSIDKGEFVAIVGASGSGKSTVLSTILGLTEFSDDSKGRLAIVCVCVFAEVFIP